MPMVVLSLLRETTLQNWYYRAMGAQLGKGVVLGGNTGGAQLLDHDLVCIEDGVHIDVNTMIVGHDIRHNALYLGYSKIGARCTLGLQCLVMPGTDIAPDTQVLPSSLLNMTHVRESGQVWGGSPVVHLTNEQPMIGPPAPSVLYQLLQLGGVYLYALLFEGMLWLTICIFNALQESCGVDCAVPITLGLGMVPASLGMLLISIALKWLLLGKSQPGKRELSLCFSIRHWFVDTLFLSVFLQSSMGLLDPAVGLPAFLRSLGVKLGKRCFIGGGIMIRANIDLVTIGDDVVSGSNMMCDTAQRHVKDAGTMFLKPIRIGSTSQFGNGVVLNPGVELATKTTIGTMSCAFVDKKILEPASTWAGAPVQLYKVGRDDDEAQTTLLQSVSWGAESQKYQGGVRRTCVGIASSFITTITDMLVWSSLITVLTLAINFTFKHFHLSGFVAKSAASVVVIFATLLLAMVAVVVAKRFFIPRFLGRYPLWSRAFMTWEAMTIVMGTLGGTILPYIQGTAFMSLWLRALGSKVGTNLYMDTSSPVETDCLEIGDNCVVMPTMQAMVPHTMDRGMIQWSPIKFGNSCSTGINSCIMLMADIGDEACVGPMSVVLKAEYVPKKTYSHGNPLVLATGHFKNVLYANPSQQDSVAIDLEDVPTDIGTSNVYERTCCPKLWRKVSFTTNPLHTKEERHARRETLRPIFESGRRGYESVNVNDPGLSFGGV